MDGVPRGGMFQAMNSLKGSPVLGQLKSPVEKFLYLPHTERMQLFLSSYSGTSDEGRCSWGVKSMGQLCGKTHPFRLPACFPVTNAGGGWGWGSFIGTTYLSSGGLCVRGHNSFPGKGKQMLCLSPDCFRMRNFPWLLTFGVACSNPCWLRHETLDGASD